MSEKPRNVTLRQAKRGRFRAMRRPLPGFKEGSISYPQVRGDVRISCVVGGVTILGFFDMIGFALRRGAPGLPARVGGEPRRSRQAIPSDSGRFHPLGSVRGKPALRRAVGGGAGAGARTDVPDGACEACCAEGASRASEACCAEGASRAGAQSDGCRRAGRSLAVSTKGRVAARQAASPLARAHVRDLREASAALLRWLATSGRAARGTVWRAPSGKIGHFSIPSRGVLFGS